MAWTESLGTLTFMDLTPPQACLDDDPLVDPAPLTCEEMAVIGKAMGHPARMEIIEFFHRRNPGLQVHEEGEWEDITFRKPKRQPPADP